MSILNVMWAGGAAYLSTHKVHREILAFADAQEAVSSWLLLPCDSAPLQRIGAVSRLACPRRGSRAVVGRCCAGFVIVRV